MLLDPNNPRYQGDYSDYIYVPYSQIGYEKVQERAFHTILASRFGVKELAESMSKIGYLPIDRFVVTKYDGDKYLVIEGNRRLAAIKLILNGVVPANDEVLNSVKKIPVLILNEPEVNLVSDQWLIQGIRHIGGVKEWGPYQKAKALDVLNKEKGMSYDEAAAALGLKKPEVRRAIRALRGYESLLEHPIYGKKSKPDDFSFFDEMIGKPRLRKYFGWDNLKMQFIDKKKQDFFFSCIMGDHAQATRKIPTALSLRDLDKIFKKNPEAMTIFLETDYTISALEYSISDNNIYIDNNKAILELKKIIEKIGKGLLTSNDVAELKQIRAALEDILDQNGE